MRKQLTKEDFEYLRIIKPYVKYSNGIVFSEDAPYNVKELWCIAKIAEQKGLELEYHKGIYLAQTKSTICSVLNITSEEFDHRYSNLSLEEIGVLFKEKIEDYRIYKRCMRFHSYFAPHTEWYEYTADFGYIPNELCPINAAVAMLEYNAYLYGSKHRQLAQKNVFKKVKLLLEHDWPKQNTVMAALSKDGPNIISDRYNNEKEYTRLKLASDKLTEWPKT